MSNELTKTLLSTLRSNGSDPKKPHRFEFYLIVPLKRSATIAAQKMEDHGYTAEVSRSERKWTVTATKTMTPAKEDFDEHARFFVELADEAEGEFEGWEVELVD